MRVYNKIYERKNKEQYLKDRKAYRNLHKEDMKQYRIVNKEHISKQKRSHNETPAARYQVAKQSAKRRGYTFYLSKEEYLQITVDKKCHYCGSDLSKTGSGLDRMNNEPYYRTENSVPCCKICNTSFMDFYTYNEKLIIAEARKAINLKRQQSLEEVKH
jgi:hypothetical protein